MRELLGLQRHVRRRGRQLQGRRPQGGRVAALSEEYTLSCCENGGCNGDDNTTVLAWAKAHGLPETAVYGPYAAGSGTPNKCAWTPTMKLYPITDWGFSDSNGGQGVTKAQDVKNCIAYYGCVGCAIAADDQFMNNPPGTVFQGSGSTAIDHDIVLCGWDDSKGRVSGAMDPSLVGVKAATTTAWLLRNSWGANSCLEGPKEHHRVHKGATWCDGGYCWIVEGANLVGTESVFGFVTAPGPAPTPPPTPGPSPYPPAVAHLEFASGIVKGRRYSFTAPHNGAAGEYGLVPGRRGRAEGQGPPGEVTWMPSAGSWRESASWRGSSWPSPWWWTWRSGARGRRRSPGGCWSRPTTTRSSPP